MAVVALTVELLRAAAAQLRADVGELLKADEGVLTGASADAVGFLARSAARLEETADRFECDFDYAAAYLADPVLAWSKNFEARVARAASLEELAALGDEGRRRAADPGHLPIAAVVGRMQASLQKRAGQLAEESIAAERLEARRRRLFQLLGEVGATDPVAYRAYMAETLARPVETSKSLSAEDTERVIARLEGAAAQQEPQSEGVNP